jgi:hypothetical protein
MRERKLEGCQAGTEEPPLCTTTHVYCSAPGAGDTRPRHHPATAIHGANPPRRRRAAEPERTLRRSSICPAPPALHAAAQRVRQVASRFFITRAVSAQPLVPPCVRPCSAPRAARAHTDAPALPPACHTRGTSCPPISTRIAAATRNRKPAHIGGVQGAPWVRNLSDSVPWLKYVNQKIILDMISKLLLFSKRDIKKFGT